VPELEPEPEYFEEPVPELEEPVPEPEEPPVALKPEPAAQLGLF